MLQKEIKEDTLHREFDDIPDLSVCFSTSTTVAANRNRAMVVLASRRKIPSRTICVFLASAKPLSVNIGTNSTAKAPMPCLLRKPIEPQNRQREFAEGVFSLLHEPPTNHGINRTSWTMPLLSGVLKENGTQIGPPSSAR